MDSHPEIITRTATASEIFLSSNAPDNRRNPITIILPLLILVACLAVFIIVNYFDFRIRHIPLMLLFATASIVIISGMSGIYIYAYKLYKDVFFVLVAAGWIGNAFYIFLEGFFNPTVSDLWFNLLVYVFAQ